MRINRLCPCCHDLSEVDIERTCDYCHRGRYIGCVNVESKKANNYCDSFFVGTVLYGILCDSCNEFFNSTEGEQDRIMEARTRRENEMLIRFYDEVGGRSHCSLPNGWSDKKRLMNELGINISHGKLLMGCWFARGWWTRTISDDDYYFSQKGIDHIEKIMRDER